MPHHQVVLFLQLVLDAIDSGRLTYRREREKNRQTLICLGWRPGDMYDFIRTLRPEQALSPPRRNNHEAHRDERVCEFGTRAGGRDVYVKISVVGGDDGPLGCIISFHFAERPFVFLGD